MMRSTIAWSYVLARLCQSMAAACFTFQHHYIVIVVKDRAFNPGWSSHDVHFAEVCLLKYLPGPRAFDAAGLGEHALQRLRAVDVAIGEGRRRVVLVHDCAGDVAHEPVRGGCRAQLLVRIRGRQGAAGTAIHRRWCPPPQHTGRSGHTRTTHTRRTRRGAAYLEFT